MMVVAATLGAAGLCASALTACSSSNSTGGGGGTDSGSGDVTTDGMEDSAVPDSSGGDTQADTANPDTGTVDTGTVDTGTADTGMVDSGAPDGDAAPPGLVFAQNEATAFCTSLLNCCGSGGADSGAYNLAGCIYSQARFGWEGTLPSDPSVYSRGHVTLDSAKAAQCIAALKAFPCGSQTGAQWTAITQACELVVQGTIPIGSTGCISSFECAPGSYCDPTGGGTCKALQTQGQPCNTVITGVNPIPDQMCSYLGSGQPALFCDLINDAADAATCQPLLPSGATCQNASGSYYDDQACQPSVALCGDNLQCGGSASYPYAEFCGLYAITDAGGGG